MFGTSDEAICGRGRELSVPFVAALASRPGCYCVRAVASSRNSLPLVDVDVLIVVGEELWCIGRLRPLAVRFCW